MQGIMSFLLNYYIYFLFGIILFILGLIGYLIDNHKMEKYEQNSSNDKKGANIPTVDNKHVSFDDIKLDKVGKLSSYQKQTEKPVETVDKKEGV